MAKVAIIVALEREILPLVDTQEWRKTNLVPAAYGCYQSEDALVVCAGVGGAHARRAAEDVVRTLRPAALVSAGLAGALVPEIKVGQMIAPAVILDSATHATFTQTWNIELPAPASKGLLVSTSGVIGPEAKRLLTDDFRAIAVDMEAAGVAEVAQAHNLPFLALKVISEEVEFPMPAFDRFVDEHGRFRTGRLLLHAAVRPGLWSVLRRLASNTSRASRELCHALRFLLVAGSFSSERKTAIQGL